MKNKAYGILWKGVIDNGAWQLWPGYSFYDLKHTKSYKINFLYDFSNGLDTGGRHYQSFYSKLEVDESIFCEQSLLTLLIEGEEVRVQLIDDCWLHLGGSGYVKGFETRFEFFAKVVESFSLGDESLIIKESKLIPHGFPYTGYT